MSAPPLTVIAATGKMGRAFVRQSLAAGHSVVAVGRDGGRLSRLPAAETRLADLGDPPALRAALVDARVVVSCAHARFAKRILEALPAGGVARLVLLGSTRKFTRFPDATAEAVRTAERLFLAAGIDGLMLHPTMIYGAEGENNLQRVVRYVERLGVVPLPGGGRMLVQPIHVDDVAACLLAAARLPELRGGASMVIAGPEAMSFRRMVEILAEAGGRRVTVMRVPMSLLRLVALCTRALPGLPRIHPDEVRRLAEDKAFDIAGMRRVLGVEPRPFAEGVRDLWRPSPTMPGGA